MATYDNCYEILKNVRKGLNEYSTGLLQGTDTSGPHSNEYLVQKINAAQRLIYAILLKRIPEEFFEEIALTGVDSVYTLPWDFGRLLYFKDTDGNQVFKLSEKRRHLTEETGSDRLYTKRGNTLVLDKDGVTDIYTLFYYRKPRDLDQGKASAGGAETITLATSAKKIADYYNEMTIENVTKDWIDTIDDYSAARVATISETAAASDYYGIVSDIPEPFHHLIAPKAVHLVKVESPLAQEKLTERDLLTWQRMLIDALTAFCGSDDEDIEDIFCDYDQSQGVLLW